MVKIPEALKQRRPQIPQTLAERYGRPEVQLPPEVTEAEITRLTEQRIAEAKAKEKRILQEQITTLEQRKAILDEERKRLVKVGTVAVQSSITSKEQQIRGIHEQLSELGRGFARIERGYTAGSTIDIAQRKGEIIERRQEARELEPELKKVVRTSKTTFATQIGTGEYIVLGDVPGGYTEVPLTQRRYRLPKDRIIEAPEFAKGTTPTLETPPISKKEARIQPYLESRFKPTKAGGYYEIYHVDPTGVGKAKERKATKAEIEQYIQYTHPQTLEEAPTKYETAKGKAQYYYGKAKERIYEPTITTEVFDFAEGLIGARLTGREGAETFYQVQKAKEYVMPSVFGLTEQLIVPKVKETRQRFSAGLVAGGLGYVKEKPMEAVALAGVGYGLGFVVKGVGWGISAGISKLYAPLGTIAGKTAGIGLIAGSTLLTGGAVYKVGREVSLTETPEEAGMLIAERGIQFGSLGFGIAKGMKGFDVVKGRVITRGRKELIVEQAEYPTAPTKKHLKMFRESIYPELGTEPGAFHVTPGKFWKKMITPAPGTSELGGLYGAPIISTPFAGISGSGTQAFSWSVPDLSLSPAVAYLKPTGFRYSPYKWSPTPAFAGQKAVGGKYGAFIKQAKPGIADVPGMKTEVEAIFRPEAGQYVFEAGKYYTTIKDVRVPIDVFGYVGEAGTAGMVSAGAKTYTLSSYALPETYSVYNPLSTAVSSFLIEGKAPKVDVSKVQVSTEVPMITSKAYSAISKTSLMPVSSTLQSSSVVPSSVAGSSMLSSGVSRAVAPSSVLLSSRVSSKTISSSIPSSSRPMSSSLTSSAVSSSAVSTSRSFGGNFFFPGELKPKEKLVKQPAYSVSVLREATGKKPHWEKLNKQPLTRESALSMGGQEVDKSISARFRVQAEKMLKGKEGKIKKPVDTGSKYFEIHRHKFREWKQKKGVRTKTPSQFIERQKFRADTVQETLALQQSKRRASLLFGGNGIRNSQDKKSKVKKRRTPFGF